MMAFGSPDRRMFATLVRQASGMGDSSKDPAPGIRYQLALSCQPSVSRLKGLANVDLFFCCCFLMPDIRAVARAVLPDGAVEDDVKPVVFFEALGGVVLVCGKRDFAGDGAAFDFD